MGPMYPSLPSPYDMLRGGHNVHVGGGGSEGSETKGWWEHYICTGIHPHPLCAEESVVSLGARQSEKGCPLNYFERLKRKYRHFVSGIDYCSASVLEQALREPHQIVDR